MLQDLLIMGKSVQQPENIKNKKYITSCIFRIKKYSSCTLQMSWRLCYKSSKP